jgi:dTDP-glucose pyrophosphorylase
MNKLWKIIKERIATKGIDAKAIYSIAKYGEVLTEEGIKAKEKEFKEMDMEEFLFLNEVVNKMIFGIKEMTMTCSNCAVEVHTDMNFPEGPSSILAPTGFFNKYAKK